MFSKNTDDDLSSLAAKIKNALDIWIAFLTRNDLLDPKNLPKKLDNDSLKKALNVLEVMNFTPIEREAYEEHLKWFRIEANTLKKAEAKDEARGREESIEIGEARGIEKRNTEITINMLKENADPKFVAKVTGYYMEDILKLKNKL